MLASEIVDRLSDAFGKRMSEGQKRIYLEWIEKAGTYADNIIESSIQNDSTFPAIARLNNALVNKKSSANMFSDPSVRRCYYCCDTGAGPYLYDPEGKIAYKYYTRVFACKCSNALRGLPKYFNVFKSVQFEQGNYESSCLYPHIVDSIRLKNNQILYDKNISTKD